MAIEKIDPKKVRKIVSIQDEAIDKEASDMDKYEKTYNLDYVKIKEGAMPTYFLVKNVTSSAQAEIQEEHFQVELPDPEDKDGKPQIKQLKQTEMLIKYFKHGCSSYEENGKVEKCDVDLFPFSIVQEIGGFVMLRTAVGDDEKKLLES